jgi:exodeoxyribonuclease VII large subunit
MPDVYTISEITAYVRRLIEDAHPLRDTWVQGEVSNMTRARSGHWYFTLKDDDAQLRCVMWRGNAARQSIVPEDGANIIVHGSMGVYEQRGAYQFYADFIRAAGVGDLYAQFERLKAALDAEGLFDAAHKKPLPPAPRTIGVVTSADAAALQDVLNVLRRRYPLGTVLLSPTLVQGAEAPPRIAAALQRLDDSGKADVILLVRGGGSIEDLWAFNDERVARAVFAARTPVMTGVGHETDVTIADFVADARAPTPSAAAELAAPDIADLRAAVQTGRARLAQAARGAINGKREAVRGRSQALAYLSPGAAIRGYRQRVDEMQARLTTLQKGRLALLHERLDAKQAALEAASPQAILRRGYAVVRRHDDNTVVRAADDAPPGTAVTITLHEDELRARTTGEEDV